MPGWHEATKELRQDGDVLTVGILQEQHPDRARLFMQWKGMDWPLLVDSYDLLEVPYVPITLLVDEYGVIREVQPDLRRLDRLRGTFFGKDFPRPETLPPPAGPPDLERLRREAAGTNDEDPGAWRAYGDALAVWGGEGRLDDAIRAYGEALHGAASPADTSAAKWAHFRLGVAHRARFDSDRREEGDFREAVEHWTRALELDPNQYIFRRRLQQYGPRLDKPYPFYDWIRAARAEIRDRGREPVELTVEPRGSEFAQPARELRPDSTAKQPDPRGRIVRDEAGFVEAETVTVPAEIEPGGSARVHLRFRPDSSRDVHWNNEVGGLELWVRAPRGWRTGRRLHRVEPPDEAVSGEVRTVEVEVRAPADAAPGVHYLPAYALYYVCEGVNGICMYRRQDLELPVRVAR